MRLSEGRTREKIVQARQRVLKCNDTASSYSCDPRNSTSEKQEQERERVELTSRNPVVSYSPLHSTLHLVPDLLPLQTQSQKLNPAPSSEELGSKGLQEREDREDHVVDVDVGRRTWLRRGEEG